MTHIRTFIGSHYDLAAAVRKAELEFNAWAAQGASALRVEQVAAQTLYRLLVGRWYHILTVRFSLVDSDPQDPSVSRVRPAAEGRPSAPDDAH
jgi:hypothetical protein